MALQDKKIMPPPLAGSPGDRAILHRLAHGLWGGLHRPIWRLAGRLSSEERTEYRTLFPDR